ncbi:MAG: GTP cyclohydrolase FolE2 [Rhodanobacteraceae bacterium]
MNAHPESAAALPDVANDAHAEAAAALAWVGMQGLHVPLQLDADPAQWRCAPGKVGAWVNLPAASSRGIHMSRLYAQAENVLAGSHLSAGSLRRVLDGFLQSHAGVSEHARVQVEFDLLARRAALLSDRHGWKLYPCRLDARMAGGEMSLELECRVGYSSTCPASAALARQLIQQRFDTDFTGSEAQHKAVHDWLGSEQGICATPHGQRSEARVTVKLDPAHASLPFEALIEAVEAALKTPLQTAVKREDEQEFARLNGENLMFCEDAARRIHTALANDSRYTDYKIHCAHFESLHPHDAVAMAVKGVAGGYTE